MSVRMHETNVGNRLPPVCNMPATGMRHVRHDSEVRLSRCRFMIEQHPPAQLVKCPSSAGQVPPWPCGAACTPRGWRLRIRRPRRPVSRRRRWGRPARLRRPASCRGWTPTGSLRAGGRSYGLASLVRSHGSPRTTCCPVMGMVSSSCRTPTWRS